METHYEAKKHVTSSKRKLIVLHEVKDIHMTDGGIIYHSDISISFTDGQTPTVENDYAISIFSFVKTDCYLFT
jgi:phosphomevalonate kinase